MEIIHTIDALRAALKLRRAKGQSVGFVPTMGYLHDGHMTLVRHARAANDVTVVSIFVNPLQFGANEDLARYPRDLERDAAMLAGEDVDYVFAPGVAEMYPRPMTTVVDVPALGSLLEGAVRPGHFAGVATVVTKLFNIVQPDRAYFGEKDYQQLQIIRRMVEDLAQPLEVIGVATVREADGLAMSSRNSYLSPEERAAAVIVPRALEEAERLIACGTSDATELVERIRAYIATEPRAEADVVAVCDPVTLEEVARVGHQPVLLLLFVKIGRTKLLDNRLLGLVEGQKVAA